ncbi:PAS domain-containing sensor histidine kinase [Inhella sp.]|uniref:sensor histidine kinase n=1 Tax=Inhella sp. TaxID=1921806 RepID=UPI0035AF8E12
MGFRVCSAAVLLLAAGWLAAQGGPRAGSAAALAALVGAWLLWSARAAATPRAKPLAEPAAPPAPAGELLRLQALLEQLPAAAWLVDLESRSLQALSNRARRLLAPGAARDAEALRQQLLERARGQQAGQLLIDTERGSERWSLALQPLVLDGRALTMGVLLPLESALEAERLQAWQQLVQVLTHEIMNSLTPIASLAQTAAELDEPAERLLALRTIAQRAEGLQRFVADYRRVSDWPPPQLEAVDLQALLARLQLSVAPAWQARGGVVQVRCEPAGLLLRADPAQLEQALLNLVANAARATEGMAEPRLWIEARLTRGTRLRLVVRDNGPGVPAGLEQQIFLPFFSASPGGRGIGLTVARQLVHGMGGRLRHARPVEGGASFVMSF